MVTNLIPYLHSFAAHNRFGAFFIMAYVITWAVLGLIWLRTSEKIAALATIFQSFVALPLAFLFSYLAGTLSGAVDPNIAQLSNFMAMSQALGFPLVIYLFKNDRSAVPFALASITSIHFFLYSWLYQTPVYLVMSIATAVGGFVLMALGNRNIIAKKLVPALVCFYTAIAILIGTFVLLNS